MSYSRSSRKGSCFEREMCRRISLWWTRNQRDDIFWRTSSSGARAKTRSRNNQLDMWNHGDMRPDDPQGFPLCKWFCFEFKFHKRYDIKSIFYPISKGNWLSWWAKIYQEAIASNRKPILITKENRGIPLLWIEQNVFNTLKSLDGEVPFSFITMDICSQEVVIQDGLKKSKVNIPKMVVAGMPLSTFFLSVSPEVIQ